MAKNRKQLIHLHTPNVKMPEKDLLNLGEIAVQHNDAEAALYIQKNNGDIAKFIDATAVDAKIEVEKVRAEGAEGTLNGKIESLTSAVTDNEKVVATALNQIVKSVGLDENGNSPLPKNASLTDASKDVTNKVSTIESSNHTHANKTVLDGITTEKVNAWNSAKADAISSAKTYVDSLNTAMDSRVDVLETSSHTHANKAVLDDITTEKVNAWDAAKADAISSAKTYTDSAITVASEDLNWILVDGEKQKVRNWRGTRANYEMLVQNNAVSPWTRYVVIDTINGKEVITEYYGQNQVVEATGQLLPVKDIIKSISDITPQPYDRYLVGADGQGYQIYEYVIDGDFHKWLIKPFDYHYGVRVIERGLKNYVYVNNVLKTYDDVDCGSF